MTTALIFGVGRTGGYAAARAAVYGMDAVFVDDDQFETHNFEEHFLRDGRFVGELKAFALSEVFDREFPNQTFYGIPRNVYDLRLELLDDLIRRADVVLACTGNPEVNKHICALAGSKPVIVTGVYADDEDLRGFVFVSRADAMCLACWDNREEVAGRRRGEPYNFRQTAATAVDVANWMLSGFIPAQLCLIRRSEGQVASTFHWVRGERDPGCAFHAAPSRQVAARPATQRVVSRRLAPRLPWWSVLRLLPAAVVLHAIGENGRSAFFSAGADVIRLVVLAVRAVVT